MGSRRILLAFAESVAKRLQSVVKATKSNGPLQKVSGDCTTRNLIERGK